MAIKFFIPFPGRDTIEPQKRKFALFPPAQVTRQKDGQGVLVTLRVRVSTFQDSLFDTQFTYIQIADRLPCVCIVQPVYLPQSKLLSSRLHHLFNY